MMRNSLYLCHQGQRKEQLDRFFFVNTTECSIAVMADGFGSCDALPHYVDWLGEKLNELEGTKGSSRELCEKISSILGQTNGYPGKASIAVIVSNQDRYFYASLGDTRIYWPAQNLRTNDHSLAQRCIERGSCPAGKIRNHPLRNQLIQFACSGGNHTLMWSERRRILNEEVIMCTDGFWCNLDDNHIYAMQTVADLKAIFHGLIKGEEAPEDNISAVLLCDR